MRRSAKAVNFGIIYGISAFGLSQDLGISAKKAKEYIDKYFETYSDVKEYMEKNVENAKKDGYIETLLGRRRVINELRSSNFNVRSFGERAAMNMPLQGSSADIIKLAMIGVDKALKQGNYQAKLVLQVHDELVIDCPIDEADAVSNILKEEMENAVKLRIPLTVEVNVGRSWYDTK
jgi:DNA polymerase-1